MNEQTYKEASKTAQGRKDVHNIMIKEVVEHFEQLINNAPAKNKAALENMLGIFKEKINNMGNGNLFAFLADESLSERASVGYVQDVIKGKIY